MRRLVTQSVPVAMFAKTILAYVAFSALLVCFTGPAAGASDNRTEPGRCFDITFVSLKPGHSIAPAKARLSDNATLALVIENEPFAHARGSFAVTGFRFEADCFFVLQRLPNYRYTLTMKGLMLFSTYILGRATVQEFLQNERLIQEIPFLFIASASESPREHSTRKRPFL
jgi:hypothetical protein